MINLSDRVEQLVDAMDDISDALVEQLQRLACMHDELVVEVREERTELARFCRKR
jgi:hypothetical protein